MRMPLLSTGEPGTMGPPGVKGELSNQGFSGRDEQLHVEPYGIRVLLALTGALQTKKGGCSQKHYFRNPQSLPGSLCISECWGLTDQGRGRKLGEVQERMWEDSSSGTRLACCIPPGEKGDPGAAPSLGKYIPKSLLRLPASLPSVCE